MSDADDLSRDRLLAELPRDPAGRPVIGGVVLSRRLGAGGMGAVYLGRQEGLARDVAVKILPFTLVESDPTLVKRFVGEARLAASLESENVVRVFDVGCEHRTHFYVMEYVLGESVGGLLKRHKKEGRGGMTEAAALRVAIGAAKGLAAAHDRGIVHRDIKPDNILIPEGNLDGSKVADLGLAKPQGGGQTYGTLSNVAMGTPGYMAPEQAEDAKGAGPAADVFAMGATLYTMLTGAPPFLGSSLIAVMRAAASEEPTPIPATFSSGIRWVVDRCLRKNPRDRFRDGSELLQALEKIRENPQSMKPPAKKALPASAPSVAVSSLPRAAAPDRRALYGVVAGGVAVLGIAAALYLNGRAPAAPVEPSQPGPAAVAPDPVLAEVAELEEQGRLEDARDRLRDAIARGEGGAAATKTLDRIERVLTERAASTQGNFQVAWEAARTMKDAAESVDTPESWEKVVAACAKASTSAGESDMGAVRALESEARQRQGWAEAKRLKAAGQAADAVTAAKAAAAIVPGNAALQSWIEDVQAEIAQATARAERKRQFGAAEARARAEQDPAKALELWNAARALADDPADIARAETEAGALATALKAADRDRIYEAAMKDAGEALARGDFGPAEQRFKDALGARPGDAAATAGLSRVAEGGAARTYADGEVALAAAVKQKDPVAAQRAAEKMLAARPGDAAATAALAEAKRQQYAIVPTAKGGRVEFVLDAVKNIRMEFVTLKPVSFALRDAGGGSKRVTISKEFAIMTTEVTQAQWDAIMGSNASHYPGANHPVDRVTWWSAQDFLWALNSRLQGWSAALPTDAQWQYACQGGEKASAWSCGDDPKGLDAVAWTASNSLGASHAVAQLQPNGYGLFDMHGNSWEWCWDASVALADIRVTTDPAQSCWGEFRLAHGGALHVGPQEARIAARKDVAPLADLWEMSFRPILVKGEDPAPHVPRVVCDLGKGVTMAFRRIMPQTTPVGIPGSAGIAVGHRATLTREYWIQETEVTQAQWEAVMGKRDFGFPGAGNPAELVSWEDTQDFANKLGARLRRKVTLPTETEWEIACRGMTETLWHGGDKGEDCDAVAWTVVNTDRTSRPVGTRRPNAFGLYDMSGNVWEWVGDWFEPWTAKDVTDSAGPPAGTERVIRGGCVTDNRELAASTYRSKVTPGTRQSNIGFRVVLR